MSEETLRPLLLEIVDRIERLEARFEERSRDTRPMLEQINASQLEVVTRVEELTAEVRDLKSRMLVVERGLKDVDRTLRNFQIEVLWHQADFDERLMKLESRG